MVFDLFYVHFQKKVTEIKLLILSDSHGDVGTMVEIVEREMPDEIIHLGDCWRDAETLSFAYPTLAMNMVPGNCDFCAGKSGILLLEREGWRLLAAHGHQWQVKTSPAAARRAARDVGADILLYGHTHLAECRKEDGLWIVNPGTAGGRYAPASYGVIELSADRVECSIRGVE